GTRDPPATEAQPGRRVEPLSGYEDRSERQERVAALGPEPLAVAFLARREGGLVALPVARRDVVDDDVPRDMSHCILDGDPPGTHSDHHPELDLEIEGVR